MNLTPLAELLATCPYPAAMRAMDPVHCGIRGRGFYPGAKGYVGASAHGGIMLLGRDFGTWDYFKPLSGDPPRDEWAVTWRNTRDHHLKILEKLPVWCTNYCVGVRVESPSIGNIRDLVSDVEWIRYETFCWTFLQVQVLTQRPRVVVVMGPFNQRDLSYGNRLGKALAAAGSYEFCINGEHHIAKLKYGDHPRAFTNRVVSERGDLMLRQLRQECRGKSSEIVRKPSF